MLSDRSAAIALAALALTFMPDVAAAQSNAPAPIAIVSAFHAIGFEADLVSNAATGPRIAVRHQRVSFGLQFEQSASAMDCKLAHYQMTLPASPTALDQLNEWNVGHPFIRAVLSDQNVQMIMPIQLCMLTAAGVAANARRFAKAAPEFSRVFASSNASTP